MKSRKIAETGYMNVDAKDIRTKIFIAVKDAHPDPQLLLLSVEADGMTHMRTDFSNEDLEMYLEYLLRFLREAKEIELAKSDPKKMH